MRPMDGIAPLIFPRPRVYLDGDSWCAVYGPDIVAGVSGWGATEADARADFIAAWTAATERERWRAHDSARRGTARPSTIAVVDLSAEELALVRAVRSEPK